MIDAVQLVVLLILVVVTIVFVIIGIQVFYILRELRKTVMKANKVLDNTSSITESVSTPLSAFSTVVSGLTAGSALTNIIKMGVKLVSGTDKEEKKEKERQDGGE